MNSRFRCLLALGALGIGLMAASQGGLRAQQAGAAATARYGYFHQGQFVTLNRSDLLIGLPSVHAGKQFAAQFGLQRDPLSDRAVIQQSGVALYQAPATKDKFARQRAVSSLLTHGPKGATVGTQPVFDQGGALMIPGDEVLVGFAVPVSLAEARAALAPYAERLGLGEVRAHDASTVIVKIANPGDGRAFLVAQALAQTPGFLYAEPNLYVLMRSESNQSDLEKRLQVVNDWRPTTRPLVPGGGVGAQTTEIGTQAVNWVPVLTENFEAAVPGWTVGTFTGATQALPVTTTTRKRGGARSLYMTGGGAAGVVAPGPYPGNCDTVLDSPALNLGAYEEAYLEFWLYQKTEDPGNQVYDYGVLSVYNPANNTGQNLNFIYLPFTGDMTTDPTTAGGWRRCLARIPPTFRINGARLRFRFHSDESNGAEGLYLDDVRVVGTANVDSNPLTTDPYSGRQYELRNQGQIAALGNDNTDLNVPEAWAKQAISPDLVVAVVDDGVDLTHPDLNLVTGYNAATGTTGGAPGDADSNHGTSVSGNVGAKANGIGVVGTAPGVKIMPINFGATFADIANAFPIAVQHGAKVISNSWGWDNPPVQAIQNAIQGALNANVTVLFASGNGPDRSPFTYNVAFPGRLTSSMNIITVGATSPTDEHKNASSSDGQFSWGSSYLGAGPDVCAPGPWSYTADRQGAAGYNANAATSGVDDDYNPSFGGTSSSTPKVAGIVVLLLSKNRFLTPLQVKTILRNTAKDIGAAGVDDATGAGRVNALAALNAVPPPTPPKKPKPPTNLKGRPLSTTEVALFWRDRSNNEDAFVLDIKVGSRWLRVNGSLGANATSAMVSGLVRNKSYSFRVRAKNAGGESKPSNAVKVKTKKK